MSWHIHEVYSWWCWYILWWVIVDEYLKHDWHILGTWLVALVYGTCLLQIIWYRLVHGWCTCLWYRLITGWVTGWCMVHVYWYMFTTIYLTVIVWQWFHHSCSPATTERWIQPHVLAPSCHPKVEVEWWNHCQSVTVRYTILKLYE